MMIRLLTLCSIIGLLSTSPLFGFPPSGFGPPSSGIQATNQVKIVTKGKYRYIYSNAIPDHQTGRFPNRNNPNSIRPQRQELRIPVDPQVSRNATPVGHSAFGVAINGVLFDPATAEFWNRNRRSGWNYEALSGKMNLGLDSSNAHVQPTGTYHYHGLPNEMISKLGKPGQVTAIGYAADGFPIYTQYGYADANDPESKVQKMKSSYQVKKGRRPNGPRGNYDGTFVEDYVFVAGSGDLDECNGRVGVTPEFPDGIYHYYITEDFPFIPRNYRGNPDPSFQKRGPPPGGGGRPPGPPPRGNQRRPF